VIHFVLKRAGEQARTLALVLGARTIAPRHHDT
jgi:hypothetical protein